MNTLEGVNEILSRAEMRPVSALDTGGASWAAQAERLLDREALSVQVDGWNFNHLENVTWTPNGSNEIEVPDTVIWCDTYGESEHIDVSMRGGKLYNRTDNTTTFTSSVKVEYVERWEFGCIPHPIQELIVARAAVEFIKEAKVAGPALRAAYENLDRKNSLAHSHEGDVRNVNILNSVDMDRVRGGRRRIPRGR